MLTKNQNLFLSRRRLCIGGAALALAGIAGLVSRFVVFRNWFRKPLSIQGIVWQLSNDTIDIQGDWQKLGADHLLIQWSMVDNIDFLTGDGGTEPNWLFISQQPWAQKVILGLAGNFNENIARASTLSLAQDSLQLVGQSGPLKVSGYYFPVEVDPTWHEAPDLMPKALAILPRPLWISVYDNSNIGGKALAKWLSSWLPPDVGIFFQDGVGVEARTAPVARQYADALAQTLGLDRVKVIVEAFRPKPGGGFRAASVAEFLPQLTAMQGYDIYPFAAQYLKPTLVATLKKKLQGLML